MRFGILVALVFNLLLGTETLASRNWLVGENSYLTVLSNTSEKRALQITEELQDVREVLVGNYINLSPEQISERLTVIVCRDRKTFRRLSPFFDGKPMSIGGFFFEIESGAYAVIDASYTKSTVRHIIHHEYVHFLLKSFGDRLPLWLNEGLAESFSTIRRSVRSGEEVMLVGQANKRILPVLAHYRLMSLERLFSIDQSSIEYRSSKHGQGLFYAQSWALVHYLLFGLSDLSRETGSRLFVASLDHQHLPESVFVEATGVSFDEMEKRVNAYLRGGELRVEILPRSGIPESDRVSLSPIGDLEAESYLGQVILETRGVEEAYPILKEAFEANPKSRKSNEAMGFAMMKRGEQEVAQEYFDEAIRLGSTSSGVYLISAYINDQQANSTHSRDTFSERELKDQLRLIYRASDLGETASQMYALMGNALLRSLVAPEESEISFLVDGLYLYPDEVAIGLPLARLLYRRGDYEDCAAVVESFELENLEEGDRLAFDQIANDLRSVEEAK